MKKDCKRISGTTKGRPGGNNHPPQREYPATLGYKYASRPLPAFRTAIDVGSTKAAPMLAAIDVPGRLV